MATVATQLNSGSGFASGEIVTATKLNNLVNTATVTGIVNADIDAAAAIAASKLALTGAITDTQLATGAVTGAAGGGKIAASAITGQTQLTDPLADGDEFLVHDTSASALRRVAYSSVRPLTLATEQASTSGTSIDFTGIPSWAKRVSVLFNDVSTNGASIVLVRIGSGSIQSSGYVSNATTSSSNALSTTGFVTTYTMDASYGVLGSLVINLVSGFSYVASGVIGLTASGNALNTGSTYGKVTLSGLLDRVRITTVNGTDTFDAGKINIMYE